MVPYIARSVFSVPSVPGACGGVEARYVGLPSAGAAAAAQFPNFRGVISQNAGDPGGVAAAGQFRGSATPPSGPRGPGAFELRKS